MQIFCLVEVGLNPQLSGTAANIAQSSVGGFLHDIPQVAGKFHLAGARDYIYLDLEDFSSHRGPGQTVDHADLPPRLPLFRVIFPYPQILGDGISC